MQAALQLFAQQRGYRTTLGEFLSRQFARHAEADDGGNVFRTASQIFFLPAAIEDGMDVYALIQHQGTCALWSVDLVSGQAHGLYAQCIEIERDFTEGSGVTCAQKLLPAAPTAIFVANDAMAVGALRALRRAGRQVPQDVALIGYDDVPIAAALEPALTTVRQPITRLGSMAAEVLIGMLDSPNGADGPPHKVILPTELVVRYSCGALH